MKKKRVWLLIVFVAIVALVVGLVVLVQPSEEITEEDLVNYEEKDEEYVSLSDSVSVVYEVLAGDVEISYEVDQGLLELRDLKVDITLLNISQRTIKQTEVALRILDEGEEVLFEKYLVFQNINPGEKKKGNFGIIKLNKIDGEAAEIVIALWKVWGEESSTQPEKTVTTLEPELSPASLGPKEVIIDFWTAIINGQYEEAKKYCSPEFLPKLDEIRVYYDQNPSEIPQEIKIINEEISADNDFAQVKFILYIKGSGMEIVFELYKENGDWRL